MKKVGVLALQGAFIEHEKMLRDLGADVVQVRKPEQLEGLDGLIIPLRQFAHDKPTWGTCAGMIFLAKDIGIDRQPILGLMDIKVNRNAFGRQIDSFETELPIPVLGEPAFHAVFIRAPLVTHVDANAGVDVLSTLPDGRIVAAQQGHLLATAFHPELTGDARLHRYFLSLIAG